MNERGKDIRSEEEFGSRQCADDVAVVMLEDRSLFGGTGVVERGAFPARQNTSTEGQGEGGSEHLEG